MGELHEQGKSISDIEGSLKTIPLYPETIRAIKFAFSVGCDLRILSDANLFFIKTILEAHDLLQYFTEIKTNPSSVDEDGRLRICPYHPFTVAPHGCNLCPPNIKNPLPLGPIPALHNLCVVLASLSTFVGCLEATAVEIRETRWIWQRSKKSAAEWIMCFPLGTRPSGRVFFWSYIFYLTKYHQLFDTVIWMLLKKPLTFLHVFHHVMVLCMCFVWLEFSQSMQIVGILANTLVYAVIYSYFLWRDMGLPYKSTDVAARLQLVHLGFTVVASIGLLGLHFWRQEGCNGMGAWLFNAFLNGALVLLFLNFYLKKYYKSSKAIKDVDSPCKRTKQL